MLHNILQIPHAVRIWTVPNHCAGFPVQSGKTLWPFPVKVLKAIEYRYIVCPGNSTTR